MLETFLVGILVSALVGLATGWVRYWMGFFVLFQGVGASLLIAWLVAKYARRRDPVPTISNRAALLTALAWLAVFWYAQIYGLGLAQPWFDPFGYFGRILQGDAHEMAFGLRSTAGWARGFSGGFGGGFWIFLNAFDSLFMFFFLFRMPWPDQPRRSAAKASSGPITELHSGGES